MICVSFTLSLSLATRRLIKRLDVKNTHAMCVFFTSLFLSTRRHPAHPVSLAYYSS